jgi:hypothetical protein
MTFLDDTNAAAFDLPRRLMSRSLVAGLMACRRPTTSSWLCRRGLLRVLHFREITIQEGPKQCLNLNDATLAKPTGATSHFTRY